MVLIRKKKQVFVKKKMNCLLKVVGNHKKNALTFKYFKAGSKSMPTWHGIKIYLDHGKTYFLLPQKVTVKGKGKVNILSSSITKPFWGTS